LAQIKAMESLQDFDVDGGCWSVVELLRFCSPPHRLQRLQKLGPSGRRLILPEGQLRALTSEHLQALLQFPALTNLELSTHCLDVESLPLLTQFKFLRAVSLRFAGPTDAALLLPSFRSIGAQLDRLSLASVEFASEDLSYSFFSLVPSLSSLTLTSVHLPSLAGPRSLRHLRELAANNCTSEGESWFGWFGFWDSTHGVGI
jgi:hypothetical protein